MKHRYLLLILAEDEGHQEHIQHIATLTQLPLVWRHGRIILFSDQLLDVLLLPKGNGVIIGKLFRRHGYPEQVCELKSDDAARFAPDPVQSLIEHYWGSYVAAISISNRVTILRDPSGGMPCYYLSLSGIAALTSDISLLIDTGLFTPSVNWNGVGRTLYWHQLPPEETALSGVSQLLGGCSLILEGREINRAENWSPWNYTAYDGDDDRKKRSEGLWRVVQACISAWASCFPRALVGLSGGLDSSIVTACLARSSAKVTCLTLATDDPVGDERSYARYVSGAIDAELIEDFYSNDDIDLDKSVAAGFPIPSGKAHEQTYNKRVRAAAATSQAAAFFVGAGGDNVFYLTHSVRPLLDRLRTEGWSLDLVSTARDICRITGANIWEVVAEAVRISPRTTGLQWNGAGDYLSREFVESERGLLPEHPWLNSPATVPLGKKGHVAMILRALHHIEHRDKALAVPMISPLLSQPVIEFCLGVPSWWACEGGIDRAVARRAFADVLPAPVSGRSGKGSPDGFVARFIARHRAAISERLLEGNLARHGLLDRAAVERVMAPNAKFELLDCPRVMALLDTEAWTNSWSAR